MIRLPHSTVDTRLPRWNWQRRWLPADFMTSVCSSAPEHKGGFLPRSGLCGAPPPLPTHPLPQSGSFGQHFSLIKRYWEGLRGDPRASYVFRSFRDSAGWGVTHPEEISRALRGFLKWLWQHRRGPCDNGTKDTEAIPRDQMLPALCSRVRPRPREEPQL